MPMRIPECTTWASVTMAVNVAASLTSGMKKSGKFAITAICNTSCFMPQRRPMAAQTGPRNAPQGNAAIMMVSCNGVAWRHA